MRVGTGGVLLPYYSAFRTAEAFRMLEALYPGRIDLGVGRAPGGDARTAQAVGGGHFPDAERFPQQVWELMAHLDGSLPPEHPFKRVRLQPEVSTAPEVWLLGSSDYSGALAAQLGLPFSFAHVINPHGGDEVRNSTGAITPLPRFPNATTMVHLRHLRRGRGGRRAAGGVDRFAGSHMALHRRTGADAEAAARHEYTPEERQT